MASLMDMIMMQRQGMDDPRYAANMQAADLQSRFAQAQPVAPPSFAGVFSPTMPPSVRAPMMMAAPPLQMFQPIPATTPSYSGMGGQDSPRERMAMATPVPSSPPAYSGYGGQDSPRERVAMAAPGAPMQLASAAPSVRESFMQRLLSGPNYQSNSMPVMPQGATTPQQINFGNPDNPADFVRADRALMGLPEEALRVAGLLG